jgi:hypothetical protein
VCVCSDDPWNQTPADNVEWLSKFKKDAGISDNGGEEGTLSEGQQ